MSNTGFDPFKVKPGSKGFGYINIVDTVAISFDMPLCVVNGEKEGPTLAVTGGLYPTEYYGIEAASRLYQMLDPKKLKGRFIAVPCVNMPALQFRLPWLTMRSSSYTPFDGLNVNSCFPGDPNGRPTQVLAHKLYQILSKANYQIDFRGGDLPESHLSHTIYPRIGEKIDETSELIAKAFGLQYVLPGTPDIGHTGKGTLVYELAKVGVATMISESGLGYKTQPSEEEVYPHIEGTLNIMKQMGMIEGKPKKPESQRFLDMQWHRAAAGSAGIFVALADQGDILEKGQVIGRIKDLDGSLIEEVKSPIKGVVHTMFVRRVVYPGDTLFTLLKLDEPTDWV
jgi:predicted deacylase